ncbi:MAK10-like protein [Tanacetum coccineum]
MSPSSEPSLLVTPPPINTEATTITTSLPEITPFIALQLRVARLEQEMSEVKKTDVLERHTADLIEKYSVLPGPESVKNQESEKTPKEIIKAKKEQDEEKQDSTYSIRSTDKVDLEEFDLKSALFSHMNKKKSANKNTTNYRLYHALMEALIADEDAMDKEVADKVKDHKRKHDSDDDEDDDDDEGPSAGSNQGRSTKKRRSDSAASGSAKPPPKDDDQSSQKPRESDASASKQHPTGWQITDTRDAGADSSMHRSDPESEHSEQSSDDISKQDERNDSDMEDTDNAHIPKVSTTTWFKPIPESERPATPEPEWTIPPNDFPEPEHNWANAYATTFKVPEENKLQRKTYDIGSFIKWFCRRTVDLSNPEGHQILRNIYEPLPLGGPPGQVTIQPQFFFNKDLDYLLTGDKERKIALSISKLKAAHYLDFGLEELVPSLWVESEREYDISAVYGITHWWFRRKEFYINKHSESSDREAVRSQMRILSVISVKVFEKYGYNYLREIILRRADYQEYKISEKDFKNLHPNDFEDLFLLNIQEKLNICQGQTRLVFTQPSTSDYYFKEDYTIVPKPRAVVYRDRNNQRKLMRLNELHKFSDGTLTRVMEKLDQMVKDFHLFESEGSIEVWKALLEEELGTIPDDPANRGSTQGQSLVSVEVLRYTTPTIDPQCSSHPSNSINAIKAHFKEATTSQTSLRQPEIENKPSQPEEPKQTLEDEFQDLHLNLPVLEVLAHAPIYNAILDKYVESLELGKNGTTFVQREIPAKIGDPRLFTLPCRLGDSKPFDTLADLGSCADGTKSYPVGIVKDVEVHIGKLKLLNDFYVLDMKKDPETPLLVGRGFLATANAVIDCRMAKIAVGEGITRSVSGVKGVDLGEEEAPYWTTLGKRESYKPRPSSDGIVAKPPYYARKDFLDCHLTGEWEISRDAELNPFKDTLVFRRMVEFLGAIPINLKCNMWESENLIKKPINWDKPSKMEMEYGMPRLD